MSPVISVCTCGAMIKILRQLYHIDRLLMNMLHIFIPVCTSKVKYLKYL